MAIIVHTPDCVTKESTHMHTPLHTSNDYYIFNGEQLDGPFDLISMVRKIRNDRLYRKSMVCTHPDYPPRCADEFPELLGVFDEEEDDTLAEMKPDRHHRLSLGYLLKEGVDFLRTNQIMSVFSGLVLMAALAGSFALGHILEGVGLYIITSVWCYYLFMVLQALTIRKTRMQIITGDFLSNMFRVMGMRLLMLSTLAGMLTIALPLILIHFAGLYALGLILFPGSLVMLMLLFAPLLIVDRNYTVSEAIQKSAKMAFGSGTDNMTTLYFLLLINFIAGPFVIALLITLPITMSALSVAYDELAFEH